MKYGYQSDDRVVVFAADTTKEFDDFKNGDNTFPTDAIVIPDMIEMFSDPQLRRYAAGPILIYDATPDLIEANGIKIVAANRTMGPYEDMMAQARFQMEMGNDELSDRRTVAEILGIQEFDPWSNLTEEQQAEQRALNAKMEAERKAGQLSDDSFGGEATEGGKIIVRDINVKVDDTGKMSGSVKATRTEIAPHEIIVADHSYDINAILAKLRIPENRVIESEPGRVMVRLHSFQIEQIERFFSSDGLNDFSITGDTPADQLPEGAITNFAPGYSKEHMFFVCSSELDPEATRALLSDVTPVIVEHTVDGRGWLVCLRRRQAEKMVDELLAQQIDALVVAVNKLGIPIVDPKGIFKVIDDGEIKEIGARPWDEDTTAWDAFSDQDREDEIKKIEADEFIFAVREISSNGFKSRVWICPMTYFQRTEEMWEGYMPIDKLAPPDGSGLLIHVEGSIFKTRHTGVETRNGLARAGFRESLLLHLYLNDRDSAVI